VGAFAVAVAIKSFSNGFGYDKGAKIILISHLILAAHWVVWGVRR
jgi:hypothetical protein